MLRVTCCKYYSDCSAAKNFISAIQKQGQSCDTKLNVLLDFYAITGQVNKYIANNYFDKSSYFYNQPS